MRLLIVRQTLGALGLTLLAVVPTDAGPMYSITDLGTLPGTSQSKAVGINASGQVIGVSYNTTSAGSDARSFLYDNGQLTPITPMGGGPARAINDLGQVVGGNLIGINNSGSVIGVFGSSGENGVEVGGMVKDLGELSPYVINSSGIVAGNYNGSNAAGNNPAVYQNGGIQNLGPSLGIKNGYINAINDLGDFLITSIGATPELTTQTLLYRASSASLTNLTRAVGTNFIAGTYPLGSPLAEGYALNNHDQVVGNGWLYSAGQANELNDLIPKGTGWNLTQALSINGSGQIVGDGTINGQTHAFLMTPAAQTVPEPSTLVVYTLMAVGAGLRMFQHRSR